MRSNKSRIINLQRCQWKKHTHKTHHRDLSEMINDYCISDAFIAFMVSCVTRGNRYPTPRPSVLIHTAYTNYGGKGLGEIILDYMKISFLDLPHQVTFLTRNGIWMSCCHFSIHVGTDVLQQDPHLAYSHSIKRNPYRSCRSSFNRSTMLSVPL